MSPFLKRLSRRKTVFDEEQHTGLKRVLGVRDLTAMGVAAIIGAGIFSTIGAACFNGGPGVVVLFIITAIASGFSALCYAEFASRIPVSGSAYTYAYATFGEFAAWIIGWALILEYSIGNIAVAQSWSGYFSTLVNGILNAWDQEIPAWLCTNYPTAKLAFADATAQGLKVPVDPANLPLIAWLSAPEPFGFRVILDLPAIAITCLITWLVYRGVRESRNVSNVMVIIKVAVIVFVILAGSFFVETENWSPFLPNGFGGVVTGISAVFFAYIGFDAISTTAEECKNPSRDLPRGMFYSLAICTVLYILVTLVLTGMSRYSSLKVMDPLAFVFEQRGFKQLGGFISASAVVALTGVLLVFQLGQPRIWLSMSRDGLLPRAFSRIHPKFKTPSFATIVTGLVVGLPLFFFTTGFSVDFTSIGTLFAFLLVCAGVLLLPHENREKGKFSMPGLKGTYIIPSAFIILLAGFNAYDYPWAEFVKAEGWDTLPESLLKSFVLVFFVMSVLTMIYKWKFIPVAGVLMCAYLLTGMNGQSWVWFFGWFAIGIVFYFAYGFRHSKLRK